MEKKSIKQIGFIAVTSLALSACGGGSSSNENSSSSSKTNTSETPVTPPVTSVTPPTTVAQNILTLPISEFRLKAVNVGTSTNFYSILENYKVEMNTQLSEDIKTLFQQSSQHNPTWSLGQEYMLTQDKLYYSESSQHQQYILKNSDSALVLGYDQDGKGLTKTITFKNIDLSNQQVNSSKITTDLLNNFEQSSKNDSNYIKLKNSITQRSDLFEKGALCHQYLTQKFNQPNIIFGSFDGSSSKTLEQWVSTQEARSNTVTQSVWGGLKIAYVSKSQEKQLYIGTGYREPAAIEMNGKLYEGIYDPSRVFDYSENYDSTSQFRAGICNLYNKTAASTLSTVLQSLPNS